MKRFEDLIAALALLVRQNGSVTVEDADELGVEGAKRVTVTIPRGTRHYFREQIIHPREIPDAGMLVASALLRADEEVGS